MTLALHSWLYTEKERGEEKKEESKREGRKQRNRETEGEEESDRDRMIFTEGMSCCMFKHHSLAFLCPAGSFLYYKTRVTATRKSELLFFLKKMWASSLFSLLNFKLLMNFNNVYQWEERFSLKQCGPLNFLLSHYGHVDISAPYKWCLGDNFTCVNTFRVSPCSGLPPARTKCLATHNKYLMIQRC